MTDMQHPKNRTFSSSSRLRTSTSDRWRFTAAGDAQSPQAQAPSHVSGFIDRFVSRTLPYRAPATNSWDHLDTHYHAYAEQLASDLSRRCELLTRPSPPFFVHRVFRRDLRRLQDEYRCFHQLISAALTAALLWAGPRVWRFGPSDLRDVKTHICSNRGLQRSSTWTDAGYRKPALHGNRIPDDPIATLNRLCSELSLHMFITLQQAVDCCLFGLVERFEHTARFCYTTTTFDASFGTWSLLTIRAEVEHAMHIHRISSVRVHPWDASDTVPMPKWAKELFQGLHTGYVWEPCPDHGIRPMLQTLTGNLEEARVASRSREATTSADTRIHTVLKPNVKLFDPAILFGNVVICGWDESDLQPNSIWHSHRCGQFHSPDDSVAPLR